MGVFFSATIDPEVADADGVCQSQAAAGAMTINGALATGGVATFSAPAHVTLTSTADLSAITFTVVGTSRTGEALTEAIAGPNNNTVTCVKNFQTVTSVTPSASTGANTLTVGVSATSKGPPILLNRFSETFDVSVEGRLSSGASLTYGWQYTLSDIVKLGEDGAYWGDIAGFTGKTADFADVLPCPCVAVRPVITAYTSGTLTVTCLQWGS